MNRALDRTELKQVANGDGQVRDLDLVVGVPFHPRINRLRDPRICELRFALNPCRRSVRRNLGSMNVDLPRLFIRFSHWDSKVGSFGRGGAPCLTGPLVPRAWTRRASPSRPLRSSMGAVTSTQFHLLRSNAD